jgi:hypothetical protein
MVDDEIVCCADGCTDAARKGGLVFVDDGRTDVTHVHRRDPWHQEHHHHGKDEYQLGDDGIAKYLDEFLLEKYE